MPGHKIGRLWKFRKEEVDDWVRSEGAGRDEQSAPAAATEQDSSTAVDKGRGEAARNLPGEWKDRAFQIEWRKIAALKNILAHEYFGMRIPMVWDIVKNRPAPF